MTPEETRLMRLEAEVRKLTAEVRSLRNTGGISEVHKQTVVRVTQQTVYDTLRSTSTSTGVDHGKLSGLGDDDHSHYHTDGRAATWLAALNQLPIKVYSQDTEPNIAANSIALWLKTDTSTYYLLADFGGTQKKVALT